ncbi:MAG: purine-nucleoside phosphorylase [Bacilli bacterium]|nr:purine-nucleoside phosphorylase [Bacillales bacterium]MDY2574940.1 purine-nucleoside phosphorylase [Bacilli bacterium]
MSTPHNQAPEGAFAKTVLMPGDPLRAKFIAENFLTDVVQVNSVRNMLGYTGYYKGKKVSVMGSGMGMPSIGIYSHELYSFYGVEKIIRIGTCGAYAPECKVFDLILAEGACTNSNWAHQFALPGVLSAIADFDMLMDAYKIAKDNNMNVHVGNILSSDIFYNDQESVWKKWAKLGCLGVEMESYALYTTAANLHKKALCILTVSDSFITHEETTPEQRQTSFKDMMKVALEVAIKD